MGIRFKWGKMSPLLPDEQILFSQQSFRAITGTSLLSYKISFQAPPLWLITLYITNRRCLIVVDFFHLFTQEVSLWYPERGPGDETELITKVSVERGLFGSCLEIRSRDPKRPWYWLCSPNLTLRFFCRNADQLREVILEAMKRPDFEYDPCSHKSR